MSRLALFTALSLLAACSASPPTTVHLTLRAAPGLNPDETGLPNPVQTHVYMLKAAETFDNTDYFQFADKEKTVLGGDLLAQDNEMLHPGQVRELSLPVPGRHEDRRCGRRFSQHRPGDVARDDTACRQAHRLAWGRRPIKLTAPQ